MGGCGGEILVHFDGGQCSKGSRDWVVVAAWMDKAVMFDNGGRKPIKF